VFLAGPLTGTKAPTSGRFCASFKSPLTGTIADSQAGGAWGPWLKKAGYDAAIIEGKAEAPQYLLISDDGCELHDANGLWAKAQKKPVLPLRKNIMESSSDRPGRRKAFAYFKRHCERPQGSWQGRYRRGHGLKKFKGSCDKGKPEDTHSERRKIRTGDL